MRVLSIRISGLSGNIKLKGSVKRTLEARFFERIDELTVSSRSCYEVKRTLVRS